MDTNMFSVELEPLGSTRLPSEMIRKQRITILRASDVFPQVCRKTKSEG